MTVIHEAQRDTEMYVTLILFHFNTLLYILLEDHLHHFHQRHTTTTTKLIIHGSILSFVWVMAV